jgi:Tfp pilus assembly protein PilX
MTSKSPTAPPVARTPRGVGGADDGFTLVAAVAVALIGMLLATTAVTVALRSDSSAAQDRGRTQALAAAEAG